MRNESCKEFIQLLVVLQVQIQDPTGPPRTETASLNASLVENGYRCAFQQADSQGREK